MLNLQNIRLGFGDSPLFDGISLTIEAGDRYCLIGRNGEGKSTLLRVIEGLMMPDSGEVMLKKGIRLSSVPQDIPTGYSGTVASVVAGGLGKTSELIARYLELSAHLGSVSSPAETEATMKALERLHGELDAADAWRNEEQIAQILSRLDLDGALEFATLSGGTRRRVLLARALVGEPDLLLLDEPTNHLDLDTILWLEEFLLARRGGLIFVTHDRAFARKIATRVGEIDRGMLYSFDCDYDSFIARRDELLEAERKKVVEFGKKLAQEEAWLRRGVKARRTRDEGRVKALMNMRAQWQQKRERIGTARMRIVDAERSGDLVCQTQDLGFSRGERSIFAGLSTSITRGDRVGIMGPNGSGKTTLLKVLLGELDPSEGTVRRGSGLSVLYFDQLREGLDPAATVFDSIAGGDDAVLVEGRSRHVNAYLQDFLFAPERFRAPVRILSGGERNRLLLAKLFTKASNLIVLDEPSNDLDAETMDLLEELLLSYKGTVLLVSHDRDLLDNVVASTLVLDGKGGIREYAGGYSDWLLQRPKTQTGIEKPLPSEPPTAVRGEETSPKAPEKKAATRKLSFRESKDLQELPDRIAGLEAEVRSLHEDLANPDTYKAGAGESARLSARLGELEKEIASAYALWEELESRA